MTEAARKRSLPTREQKAQLRRLLRERPQLLSGKFTPTFTMKKAQAVWEDIAAQLNAIPGVNKDWRHWRKTWHDYHSRTRLKQGAPRRNTGKIIGPPPTESKISHDVDNTLDTASETSISGHAAPQSAADFSFEVLTIKLEPDPLSPPQKPQVEARSQIVATGKVRKRSHPTWEQKINLKRLVREHPQLLSGKFTPTFTMRKAQSIWKAIAEEVNLIPGVKKDWRHWRKTWQDYRSKSRCKQAASRKDFARAGGASPVATKNIAQDEENTKETTISGHEAPRSAACNNCKEIKIECDSDPLSNPEHLSHQSLLDLQGGTSQSNAALLELGERKLKLKEDKLNLLKDYIEFKKYYMTRKLEILERNNKQ